MTLQELTKEIAGKKESRLVLIGARPTMGKTSVAMGMALKLAEDGKKVNYFSFSEKDAYMTQHFEFINKGSLSETIKENLRYQNPVNFTISELMTLCGNQPDAVFIDTLQEINKGDESILDLQKELKEMAAKLDCPVIVLSQLTDKIDKRLFSKKPRVSDLAETDIDARLFDEVLLFFRKSRYDAKAPKSECLMVFKNKEAAFTWSDSTNCIM